MEIDRKKSMAYEDLLAEITRLYEELETADCAVAVDDLCHGTLENKIKEIKSSTSRVLSRALERYFAEYAQKLLRTYAKKLKPDLSRLKQLSLTIDLFLREAEPSLLWAADIYRLRDEAKEAFNFFPEKLWFLPDRGNRKQLDRWIAREFKQWYDSESLDNRLEAQLIKLEELSRAIPGLKFRQCFPENPKTLIVDHVPECSLCDGDDRRRIRFCKSCAQDNVACYTCFCKHAWARQHDEYRVFSELQSIPCPFCRREFAIGDAYTVFEKV